MALPSEADLLEFLQSPTWSNSRDLLTMHPDLLDPAVDRLVERMMGYARDANRPQSLREFEQQLGLLRRSRQIGVDAAFAELSGQPRAYIVEEDQNMVRQQAEDAQQYYERTGDHDALTLALNLWLKIYTDLKDPAALRRIITALKEGIRLAPPDSTLQFIRIGALGYASFFLFVLTHETGELKRNMPAVKRTIPTIERRLSALDSSREGEQMLRQLHDNHEHLVNLTSQYLST